MHERVPTTSILSTGRRNPLSVSTFLAIVSLCFCRSLWSEEGRVSTVSEKEGAIELKQKSLDAEKKKEKPSVVDSRLRVISNHTFTRRTFDMACSVRSAIFIGGWISIECPPKFGLLAYPSK